MTSRYEHVVARDAERLLQRARRRRVTHARRVVDVVRADEARRLLRGVVHLVGDAARGEVEAERGRAPSRGSGRRRGRARRPTTRAGTRDRRGAAPSGARAGRARAARARCSASSAATSASASSAIAGAVLTFSSSRRVVHRCTPLIVQSWKPATPSAHPSHTPLRRMRHAYGRLRRFSQTILRDVAVVVRLLLADAVRLPADPEVAPQPLRAVHEIAPRLCRLTPSTVSRRGRCARDACTR